MYRIIVAAVAAALLASPAFGGGCTGIGKGSPMSGAAKTPVTTPNPCKPGDTYDATKNLCTAADGTTYTPASP